MGIKLVAECVIGIHPRVGRWVQRHRDPQSLAIDRDEGDAPIALIAAADTTVGRGRGQIRWFPVMLQQVDTRPVGALR